MRPTTQEQIDVQPKSLFGRPSIQYVKEEHTVYLFMPRGSSPTVETVQNWVSDKYEPVRIVIVEFDEKDQEEK